MATETEEDVSDMFVALAKKVEEVADKTETDLKVLAKTKKTYDKKKKEGSATEEDKSALKKAAVKFKKSESKLKSELRSVASKTGMSTSKTLRTFKRLVAKKDRDYFRKLLCAQQTMSICFVFDATASMGPFFTALKDCIRCVIGKLQDGMVS